MRRKKKMIIWLVILGVIVVSGVALYQPAINYLSKQAANPSGFIGSIMTKIWSVFFKNMNE